MASRNKAAALLLCFLFLAAVAASAAEVCVYIIYACCTGCELQQALATMHRFYDFIYLSACMLHGSALAPISIPNAINNYERR
jgi:hypothetical protein